MKHFWQQLWQTPRTRWLLGIPLGGFFMLGIGAIGLGTTNYIVHKTSENEFCYSCHSHKANIRAEYEASSHFTNKSGIQTQCADCHLPQDNWFELMTTKIVVSADIIPELAGHLDTPEKYEAQRGPMAEKVWKEYRENDSRYCRNCHSLDTMRLDLQSSDAAKLHKKARTNSMTCIDCHKGLVHALPKSVLELSALPQR